jgi:hypothetical protein
MRNALIVLFLTLPTFLFGQSLAEVAKKEKDRREENKKQGKEATVISETDLESFAPLEAAEGGSGSEADGAAPDSRSTSTSSREDGSVSEEEGEEENVPESIPPDRPLAEKLAMFEKMKRQYDRQVQEIDKQIGENEKRLREIDSQLASTSALGGAGLPVAPQAGTGAATRPMTGQESATLVGEQNRLQSMNDTLRARKDQLKLNLQEKGRVANIPAGYLRF